MIGTSMSNLRPAGPEFDVLAGVESCECECQIRGSVYKLCRKPHNKDK